MLASRWYVLDVRLCNSLRSCINKEWINIHVGGNNQAGGAECGKWIGVERKEPSVEKPPMCGPSPFNPKGTDPITLLTQSTKAVMTVVTLCDGNVTNRHDVTANLWNMTVPLKAVTYVTVCDGLWRPYYILWRLETTDLQSWWSRQAGISKSNTSQLQCNNLIVIHV
jgi:hypothetical protein